MNCEGKQKRVISENTPPELGCQYAALRRSTKVLTGVAGYPAGWAPRLPDKGIAILSKNHPHFV